MKKFWNLNNRGMNSQIKIRRSNMKRRIAMGIIGGIALAAVISTSVGLSGTGEVESVTDPVSTESVQTHNESFAYWSIEPGTSLTVDNAKVENDEAQLPNESFAYFSIEPGTTVVAGEKLEVLREYAGTSPDLPELDGKVSVEIIQQAPRDLVDFNNGFYAGELLESDAEVIDVAELDERTARDLVDFQNGFYAGEAMLESDENANDLGSKYEMEGASFANTSPDLPGMDVKIAIRAYVGTSPDLPELGVDMAKVEIQGESFAGGSPDLP